MATLPLYIPVIFLLTVSVTIILFYKAAHSSKTFLVIALTWMALQSVLALSGLYANGSAAALPLLVVPPLIFIIMLFTTKQGKVFVDDLELKTLTILHCVRIPVELVLYLLFVYKWVPQLLTFEGRNFDILSGLSAPIIYYFGFTGNKPDKSLLLVWNIVCLLLLLNVVFYAVLSAPTKFQQFAFDQPNRAFGHFPFMYLPCFIVPVVLFSHLAAIKKLIKKA